MTELDETDAEILRLLMEDARRSYREIGEAVGLSPPTISERIGRLRDLDVIERFTVNLDRSQLFATSERLIDIRARPSAAAEIVERLTGAEGVEHVVRTLDSRVLARVHADETALEGLFRETLDDDQFTDYAVHEVTDSVWNPQLARDDLTIECAECGRPVRDDGVSTELDGRRYHLCCPSCESLLRERYDRIESGAGDGGERRA